MIDAGTISGRIAALVQSCEAYRQDRAKDRKDSEDFYNGKPEAIPFEENRSRVVSRDVRAAVKDVLPSITRTILGNDEVVEFQPRGPGDEAGAQQASDFINYVVLDESGARQAIHDAIQDALKHRNGIFRWFVDKRKSVTYSTHTGLDENGFYALISDPEVEVVEHSVEGEGELSAYSARIKRTKESGGVRVEAVAPERFLIHPDAITIQNSLMTGIHERMFKSDLVAMGFEQEFVKELPEASDTTFADAEEDEREDYSSLRGADVTDWQAQEVDYYELYVRLDLDGDGIAELVRMVYAGTIDDKSLIEQEEVDEVQFCDVKIERKPHQWEGVSIADDLIEVQRVKTVLLRNTLDNIYWQNNLQPIVKENAIANLESVMTPQFGMPIMIKGGNALNDAISYNKVPFVGQQAFAMLEYFDKEARNRTGISDASAGLPPDALQNVTAKASAMMEQSGIGQAEMMVRTVAEGLKDLFKGLLRLIIRHQDKARTVRLRGDWVEFDPRQWNADMDVSVNVGLGAGTRERDMAMMSQVMALQEKLLAGFGPDNPFIKPENVWNAASKLIEAAGLKTPRAYITEPDPDEVSRLMDGMRNKPNPEQMKLQAQMQLEQAKMASNRDKESAQMEADLRVKQADIEARAKDQADKLASDAALQAQKLEFEGQKASMQHELELAKLAQQREIELAKMGMKDSEDGQPMSREDERNNAFLEAIGHVAGMIQQLQAHQTLPKRFTFDERGEPNGVETYNPNELQ